MTDRRHRFVSRWGALAWGLPVVLFVMIAGMGSFVHAHEFRPATLVLVEVHPGRFALAESPAVRADHTSIAFAPRVPDHCVATPGVLECGARGLVGTIAFPELAGRSERVLVRIVWHGGAETLHTITGAEPRVIVHGTPPGLGTATVALLRAYVELGALHILLGFDHLLFVLGLVLVARRGRTLVATITAFTLAHSLTLGLAVLELVRVPSGPVEAGIALSIVLLALEVEVDATRPSAWTQRAPWLVAFACGLLHGLGFAGALAEVGLPPHHTALALLGFNVGVELGQLAVVLALLSLGRAVVRLLGDAWSRHLRFATVLAMGSLAAWWSLDRIAAML